jgi:hypothetical protein
MKKYFLLPIIAISFLFSCKNEEEKPKVSYDTTSKKVVEQKKDTAKVVVADLPIQFDGTKFLIYPIGEVRITDYNSKISYSRSEKTDISFVISSNLENEITGNLQNLKFQRIDSDSLVSLTEKTINIQSVAYLKSMADKLKKQFLVYSVADVDSNKDGELDGNDIKSLYISGIDGSNFIKISPDFQEVIDWKIIDSRNRLYFRTIGDNNKNGAFDKTDKVHYNFVNLLDKELKAQEFSAL